MDIGFIPFDAIHWGWLLGILLAIVLLTALYVRLKEQGRTQVKRILAYTILFGEVIKLIVVWLQGKSLLYYLPIHLCGFAIVLLMLHAYRPTALVKEVLFSLTLPGAFIALLFPGWANEPIMSFIHIHSFVYHGIITAYPILLLATGELRPNYKQLWKVGIVLLLIIPLVYAFNLWSGTNYMFLNRPISNSPLMLIYETFGSNGYGYIAGLICVAVVTWLLQYGIYAVVERLRRSRRTIKA